MRLETLESHTSRDAVTHLLLSIMNVNRITLFTVYCTPTNALILCHILVHLLVCSTQWIFKMHGATIKRVTLCWDVRLSEWQRDSFQRHVPETRLILLLPTVITRRLSFSALYRQVCTRIKILFYSCGDAMYWEHFDSERKISPRRITSCFALFHCVKKYRR